MFDWSRSVGKHAAKHSRHAAVCGDLPQVSRVLPHGIEGARRIKEHETIGKAQVQVLESADGSKAVVELQLLVQRTQSGLIARLDAQVNHIQAGIAQTGEQLRLHLVRTATDFPDHLSEKPLFPERINKLRYPASPERAPNRKVVILEQKDGHSVLFVQRFHLLYNFRRVSGADLFPGHLAIKLADGAERTIAATRSEEHTSELQSRQYLVCRR